LKTQLSTAKFASAFGWTMPHWQRSLDEVVGRIVQDAAG
jgi:dTDP-4-dehydrorhamnose reductase